MAISTIERGAVRATNERDECVMAILEEALARPTPEREGFVRSECASDDSLYREVMEELAWEERMGSFLSEPFLNLATTVAPFHPGDVIAGRFEIVRQLGEGGMGIVYEAIDLKRHLRVAIKAAKPGFQRLLSPELEGALSVRHHNICVVNEIHTAHTEMGEVDFLTMELLEGKTLTEYIAERGKLDQDEARDISLQLCAALGEAHRSGILHRDLKTGNAFICEDEGGGRRVVVTDFGLASHISVSEATLAGSPGYMAPELWAGEKPSKASDIYALGAVFYKMVTGVMPYAEAEQPSPSGATQSLRPFGDRDKHGAHKILPPPPSDRVKNLDPRWDRAIMACLALAPEDRIQDAEQLQNELTRKRIRKAPFAVAMLILAVIASLVWFVPPLHKQVADLIWPPSVRLAVLPFEGPPEFRTASEGAAQEVLSRLRGMSSGRRSIAFLDPSTFQKNRVETPEQADKVLHATHALQVKINDEGTARSVHATVTDLQSHLVTRDLSVRYEGDSIGNMPAAVAGLVASALDLSQGSADKLSPSATSPYMQGLALLHRGSESADESIMLFQQAKQLDPGSPLPHTGLIEAYVAKYRMTRDKQYMEKAEEELALVQDINPNSPRVLLASGLMHEAKSQYLKALEDYRRVQELEPRNASALLKVGDIYKGLDMPEDAAKAYMAAMSLDPNYYEPYEFLGELYFNQGRFEESADYFRKTVERAPGMFDAYTNLGSLLIELQRYDEAEKVLLDSLRIKRTARALNGMGAMRAYQGRDTEAVTYYSETLTEDPNERIYLMNIADCDRRLGRKREATATYSRALQLTQAELAQNPRLAETRAYVGYFEARLGNRGRAHQEIAEALALAPADIEVQRRAVLTYEALGERELALPILRGLSLGVLKQLARHPDMADFSRDPRFKEVMITKGGQ